MKRIITYIIFLLTVMAMTFPVASVAEEHEIEMDAELKAMLENTGDASHYEFPRIEPEYSLGLGFRMVDNTGLRSLMRFGELDDTALIMGEYRAFYFPHRLFFVYDQESTEDYFGELRYAIGDTAFLRWVGSGIHRNPESVTPIGSNVSVRDQNVEYGVRKNTEDMFLRLKYPDMATHLFIRGWMVHEEGSIQERTLLGSGWFNNAVRDTAKRDYEWETHEYSLGANSHLGPIEVEVEHTDSEFKMNSDAASSSFYSANPYEPAAFRDHHRYSDTTGTGNSLKFHTSYTGKLVASATYATSATENDYSKVSSDYTFASAGVTWMPVTSFTMFLRYKRTDMDYDNSIQAGAPGISNGLSSTKDDISLTARFRPTPELVLKGRYKVEVIERDNAAEWSLASGKTTKTTYMFAAHARQARKLNLMFDYIYSETDDPAYNTEADESHTVKVATDWKASVKTLAFGSYTTNSSKRKDLLFPEGDIKAENRSSYRDSAMVGLTYMATEKLSGTLSYNYYLSSIKQDLVYGPPATKTIVPGVLYEDTVSGVSLDLNYMASEKLSLRAGANHSVSESATETRNLELASPVSITDFSKRETTDTTLNLGARYEMAGNISVEADYMQRELSEDYINIYDALENGDVQVASVKVSKKW